MEPCPHLEANNPSANQEFRPLL